MMFLTFTGDVGGRRISASVSGTKFDWEVTLGATLDGLRLLYCGKQITQIY
jgi:hypothetical protein